MLQINEAFYRLQGRDMFVQKNHSHNEIEFIHVVSGNGIVLKNNVTFELKSRHVYVIDARNAHIVYPQPEDCRDYIRNKIVIDADSFELFCRQNGIDHLLDTLFSAPPVEVTDKPDIDLLYKKICELTGEKKEEAGFANGYLLELIHWFYTHIESGQQVRNTVIQKILDIISEKEGLTSLGEISEILHLNRFYICHLFKDKTGRNLSDYLSDKIHEKSIKLLSESSYSIEEIAYICGFSAASSFTRFFKNRSGVSPSSFRKEKPRRKD